VVLGVALRLTSSLLYVELMSQRFSLQIVVIKQIIISDDQLTFSLREADKVGFKISRAGLRDTRSRCEPLPPPS
jgi:hypothetical protein